MANKNYLMKTIILLTFVSIILTSCDSLWSVQETTDVSFTIDISQILKNNGYESATNTTRSINNNYSGKKLIISLHQDSDSSLIAEQKTPLTGNVSEISARFENLKTGIHLYAQIQIFDDDTIIFSARSESVILKSGTTEIVVTPYTTFFVGGINASDTNDGSEKTPFASLHKAVNSIININTGTKIYTIIVSGDIHQAETVNITSDKTLTIIVKGDSSKPATITSTSGETIFNIEDTSPGEDDDPTSVPELWINDTPVNVTFGENLTLTGAINKNPSIDGESAVYVKSSIITLDNVTIDNNYNGITLDTSRANIQNKTNITNSSMNSILSYGEIYITGPILGNINFGIFFALLKGEHYTFTQQDLDRVRDNGTEDNKYHTHFSNSYNVGPDTWTDKPEEAKAIYHAFY